MDSSRESVAAETLSESAAAETGTVTVAHDDGVRVFRDCWLLFGNVDDVGWTHAHNVARRDIHLYLREKYPESDFESIATPNTFFMTEIGRAHV